MGKGIFKRHEWETAIFGDYIYPHMNDRTAWRVRICLNCGDCQADFLHGGWGVITFREYKTALEEVKQGKLRQASSRRSWQQELAGSKAEAQTYLASKKGKVKL